MVNSSPVLSRYEEEIGFHYGFRPSPTGNPCPASLTRRGRCSQDHSCICRYRFSSPDFLDHAFRWIDRNGFQIMTAEPYFPALLNNAQALVEFEKELKSKYDINLFYGDISPWAVANGHGESKASPASAPVYNRSSTQLLVLQPHSPIRADRFRATPPKLGPYPITQGARWRRTSSFLDANGQFVDPQYREKYQDSSPRPHV